MCVCVHVCVCVCACVCVESHLFEVSRVLPPSLVKFHQNVVKMGQATLFHDSHLTMYLLQPRPSIRQAETVECSRGFPVVRWSPHSL